MNTESDFNLLFFFFLYEIPYGPLNCMMGKGKKSERKRKKLNIVYSSTCIALYILVSVTLVSTNGDNYFLYLKKTCLLFFSISFYFRRVEVED